MLISTQAMLMSHARPPNKSNSRSTAFRNTLFLFSSSYTQFIKLYAADFVPLQHCTVTNSRAKNVTVSIRTTNTFKADKWPSSYQTNEHDRTLPPPPPLSGYSLYPRQVTLISFVIIRLVSIILKQRLLLLRRGESMTEELQSVTHVPSTTHMIRG